MLYSTILRSVLNLSKRCRPVYCQKSITRFSMSFDSKDSIINKSDHIVWVDLEMTGLDIDKDVIIEMACLITDKDLNIVAEGSFLLFI